MGHSLLAAHTFPAQPLHITWCPQGISTTDRSWSIHTTHSASSSHPGGRCLCGGTTAAFPASPGGGAAADAIGTAGDDAACSALDMCTPSEAPATVGTHAARSAAPSTGWLSSTGDEANDGQTLTAAGQLQLSICCLDLRVRSIMMDVTVRDNFNLRHMRPCSVHRARAPRSDGWQLVVGRPHSVCAWHTAPAHQNVNLNRAWAHTQVPIVAADACWHRCAHLKKKWEASEASPATPRGCGLTSRESGQNVAQKHGKPGRGLYCVKGFPTRTSY